MYAAKLFDTHRDAQTVHTLLASAEQNTHRFKNTSPREVHAAVRAARQRIEGLQPVMKSIRTRRNKMLAHLSPEAVRDPVKVGRDARLRRADLSKLFNVAHEIINEISLLYMNTTHLRSFPFEDDYKHVLKLVAEAKCAEIRKYEDEYKTRWTGARPKDCPPS